MFLVFLISAIIQVETGGKNINGDGGKSIGLMQVRVATCKEMLKRDKSLFSELSDEAVKTALSFPMFNIYCGKKYISYLIRTNKTLDVAINAYNTGNFTSLKHDTKRVYLKRVKKYTGIMYHLYNWLFNFNKKLLLIILEVK
jgi:hypothetical protein